MSAHLILVAAAPRNGHAAFGKPSVARWRVLVGSPSLVGLSPRFAGPPTVAEVAAQALPDEANQISMEEREALVVVERLAGPRRPQSPGCGCGQPVAGRRSPVAGCRLPD
jgi:hypothetical protein